VAPGTVRYFGWLFAAPLARDPLLGVLALEREWHALAAPGIDPAVGNAKLGWWQQEIERLVAGKPVHPISRFLRALPGAGQVSFAPLLRTLGAVARELHAAPPDSAEELEAQADALGGEPLRVAAAFAGAGAPSAGLSASITSLAVAQYLARALAAARHDPGGHEPLRAQAAERLASVRKSLPTEEHAAQRHLLVMAALEHKHLYAAQGRGSRLGDLLTAWGVARRAAARR
jgi:hypothetical protein